MMKDEIILEHVSTVNNITFAGYSISCITGDEKIMFLTSCFGLLSLVCTIYLIIHTGRHFEFNDNKVTFRRACHSLVFCAMLIGLVLYQTMAG